LRDGDGRKDEPRRLHNTLLGSVTLTTVTSRRWNINLQEVRAVVKGAAKRIRVCTSCIKSGKVEKAA
jgi:ribosomal protein L28